MMHYIAAEEALPFPCIPLDPETIAEIRSAERDDAASFDRVSDLMAHLNSDQGDERTEVGAYDNLNFKELLAACPIEGIELDRAREFPRDVDV